MAKTMGKGHGKDYGKEYGKGYGKDDGKDIGKDSKGPTVCLSPPWRSADEAVGKSSGKTYDKGYGKGCGKAYDVELCKGEKGWRNTVEASELHVYAVKTHSYSKHDVIPESIKQCQPAVEVLKTGCSLHHLFDYAETRNVGSTWCLSQGLALVKRTGHPLVIFDGCVPNG